METGHQENTMTYKPVDHKTVGQFTGVQSDSRIGLYEGDVITFGNSKTTHVIEWSKAHWLAKNIIPNNYNYTGRALFCDDVWGIKVIGNIHDEN